MTDPEPTIHFETYEDEPVLGCVGCGGSGRLTAEGAAWHPGIRPGDPCPCRVRVRRVVKPAPAE